MMQGRRLNMRISKRLLSKAKKLTNPTNIPTCWRAIDDVWGEIRETLMHPINPSFVRGIENQYPPQQYEFKVGGNWQNGVYSEDTMALPDHRIFGIETDWERYSRKQYGRREWLPFE